MRRLTFTYVVDGNHPDTAVFLKLIVGITPTKSVLKLVIGIVQYNGLKSFNRIIEMEFSSLRISF